MDGAQVKLLCVTRSHGLWRLNSAIFTIWKCRVAILWAFDRIRLIWYSLSRQERVVTSGESYEVFPWVVVYVQGMNQSSNDVIFISQAKSPLKWGLNVVGWAPVSHSSCMIPPNKAEWCMSGRQSLLTGNRPKIGSGVRSGKRSCSVTMPGPASFGYNARSSFARWDVKLVSLMEPSEKLECQFLSFFHY